MQEKQGKHSEKELEEAIAELNKHISVSTSNLVKNVLTTELNSLTTSLKEVVENKNKKETTSAEPKEKKKQSGNEKEKKNEVNIETKPKKEVFESISRFAWDQDGHSEDVKDNVMCDFTENSFDFRVYDLGGKNYRLFKQPLAHEIIKEFSKFRVKKDRVVITLRKTDGKYGTDYWSDLVPKKGFETKKDEDPQKSLMNMMKQMYEDGDDNMKKTIGEAMMKSRQQAPGTLPDMP
eukprot:maker-scaffold_15-snap-gene-5.57-mRNA-1 protein AED:0.09 eAED:0.37 QI:0/0/0.5/1/0/0/2/132/234